MEADHSSPIDESSAGSIVPSVMTTRTGRAAVGALLKMRCETSGAGYAIFWERGAAGFVYGGGHVTAERRAALAAEGKTSTYVDDCKDLVLAAEGGNVVATAYAGGETVYVADVASSEALMQARKDTAARYGIVSMCFMPALGGVLEYGTGKAGWDEGMRGAPVPMEELASAWGSGASYSIFWKVVGSEYVVAADYVAPERVAKLKAVRGDDKTFVGESRGMKLPVGGDNIVAAAAAAGKAQTLENAGESAGFKRAGLAKEFNVGTVICVPCADGVLEWGNVKDVVGTAGGAAVASEACDQRAALVAPAKSAPQPAVAVKTIVPATAEKLPPAQLVLEKRSACCVIS